MFKKLLTTLTVGLGILVLGIHGLIWVAAPPPVQAAHQPEQSVEIPVVHIVAQAALSTTTLNPSKDNTLYESDTGATSNGQGTSLFAGRTGTLPGGGIRRAVLAFDVAGQLPAQATVTSVTLKLQLLQVPGGGPGSNFELHRLTFDWGEGMSNGSGQGGTAQTDDATWIHRFFNTTFWNTPGGDFEPTASASTFVSGTGSYAWSDPQMVQDVQNWLDAPGSNFGWLLKSDDEVTLKTARRFGSGEENNVANRPMLIIEYTPPPDLTFSKNVDDSTPDPGQVVTFTLVVGNNSSTALTNVTISDTLPLSLTLAGPVTLDPPGVDLPGTFPVLTSGLTLQANSSVTVTFPVTVNLDVAKGTILTNTAAVTSAEVSTPVTDQAVLRIGFQEVFLPIVLKQ